MGSIRMKKRIFSGSVCEQLVYNVAGRNGEPTAADPEKQTRKRFKDAEAYEKFKEDISRRNHNRGFNASFRPGDLYATLTFDNEWEVHTFEEAKRIRRNFIRVLTYACSDAVIRCYMGRGKGTSRIHFHLVCHGIGESFLKEKWKYGKVVHVRELRSHNYYDGVDYGADFTGLANYLYDHWTAEQGGKRWYQTRNSGKPDEEEPTPVRVTGGYSEKRPPVAPKGYKLVEVHSTAYGLLYFKYVAVDITPQARHMPRQLPS